MGVIDGCCFYHDIYHCMAPKAVVNWMCTEEVFINVVLLCLVCNTRVSRCLCVCECVCACVCVCVCVCVCEHLE